MHDNNGFQYWQVVFDEKGKRTAGSGVVAEIAASGLKDLWVFSHGWNNQPAAAERLYSRFLEQCRNVLSRTTVHVDQEPGLLGILWPSTLMPDEEMPGDEQGGGASLDIDDPYERLRKLFKTKVDIGALVEGLHEGNAEDFQAFLKVILAPSQKGFGPEDRGGFEALLTGEPVATLTALADLAAPEPEFEGGAAGLDFLGGIHDAVNGVVDKIQAGAREALRAAAYWKMKQRAGTVGTKGLAPMLAELATVAPGLRFHLVGHSFGARVVSFALDAANPAWEREASPVKSLLLLQGAFSKWAFDTDLDFDQGRAGALAGRQSRVDGPLIVTHTMKDSAVGKLYPLASMLGRQDAAAFEDIDDAIAEWHAMGHKGADGVDALADVLADEPKRYAFEKGRFINLDANGVIKDGGGISGAHGDLFHPEVAWTALTGAGIVKAP